MTDMLMSKQWSLARSSRAKPSPGRFAAQLGRGVDICGKNQHLLEKTTTTTRKSNATTSSPAGNNCGRFWCRCRCRCFVAGEDYSLSLLTLLLLRVCLCLFSILIEPSPVVVHSTIIPLYPPLGGSARKIQFQPRGATFEHEQ